MNKKVKFFLLVIVAVVGLLYFYLNHSNDQILDEKARGFQVDNVKVVNKITLTKGSEKIELKKVEGIWMLDQVEVPAEKANGLLHVLSTIQVKYRIAKEEEVLVKDQLLKNGTLVKVYVDLDLLTSYYIGADLPDSSGVIGIKSKSEIPFVLYQLGDKKLFEPLFSAKAFNWMSKIIFSASDKRLEKISLTYQDENKKSSSFSIAVEEKSIKVNGYNGERLASINESFTIDYIRKFSEIAAERLVLDTTNVSSHFFTINIESVNESGVQLKTELKGFKKKAAVGQRDFSGSLLTFDNEYFYLQKESTMYLVNYFNFDGLLTSVSDFKR